MSFLYRFGGRRSIGEDVCDDLLDPFLVMGAVGGFQVLPLLVVFGLLPAPFLFGEGALGFSVDLDAPACPFQVIAAQLRGFLRDFFSQSIFSCCAASVISRAFLSISMMRLIISSIIATPSAGIKERNSGPRHSRP